MKKVLSIILLLFFSVIAKAEQVPPALMKDVPYYCDYSYGNFSTGQACSYNKDDLPDIYFSYYCKNRYSCVFDSWGSVSGTEQTYSYTYQFSASSSPESKSGRIRIHSKDAYQCPSTHPIHIDTNSNGEIDKVDICETEDVDCQSKVGTPESYEFLYVGGNAYSPKCFDSCSATINRALSLSAMSSGEHDCVSYLNSANPDDVYCDAYFDFNGETCTASDEANPTDDTSPVPPDSTNATGNNIPDFHNPIDENCTATDGVFVCNVPYPDACTVDGRCNSSCIGHTGDSALCVVDAFGFPSSIPTGDGEGASYVDVSTTTTTTTTTSNPDGSVTTTEETVTVGGSTSGASANARDAALDCDNPDNTANDLPCTALEGIVGDEEAFNNQYGEEITEEDIQDLDGEGIIGSMQYDIDLGEGSCPNNPSFLAFGSAVEIDLSGFCDFAIIIKTLVILSAWFTAARIYGAIQ